MVLRQAASVLLLPLLLVLLPLVAGQTWPTGDNSTVIGCSTHCKMDDASGLACFQKTKEFFERALVGQLRHYTAVQVNIDQWYRRHDKPDGQNFTELREQIREDFGLLWRGEHDILTAKTIDDVAGLLADRVEHFSNRTISWPPHFECPLPCEYKHTVYRNLFIASVLLNIALACAVVPFIRRMMRISAGEAAHGKRILIPSAVE